jgi:di/tricarboxylate transporter
MTTENPNHDPIQTLRDKIEHRERVVSTPKKASRSILELAVFGVLYPASTWLLIRFEHNLYSSIVWGVLMLFGFVHILLAYLAPLGLRDLVVAAVKKLRGKSNDSVTSELVK